MVESKQLQETLSFSDKITKPSTLLLSLSEYGKNSMIHFGFA